MATKTWFFLWSSRRAPVWENVCENMNLALSSQDYMEGYGFKWIPPAHWSDIPERGLTQQHRKSLNGQFVSQFENESFKFVAEENKTPVNPQHHMVIKPHLIPDIGIIESVCKTIDLDFVYSQFKNYQWVSLGFFFSEQHIKKEDRTSALSNAVLYGRNFSNKIVNLETGIHMADFRYLPVVTYVNFKLLRDKNYVVATVNPNLVTIPNNQNTMIRDHRIISLNTYSTSLHNYIITPGFSDCKVVNNTIFVKKDKQFSINLYENSTLWMKYGDKLNLDIEVDTNIKYEIQGSRVVFTATKSIGYIEIKINVGDLNDRWGPVDSAGITKLSYIVTGE